MASLQMFDSTGSSNYGINDLEKKIDFQHSFYSKSGVIFLIPHIWRDAIFSAVDGATSGL